MRKIALFEICDGRLAVDAQRVFEEIQAATRQAAPGAKSSMSIKITVQADAKEEGWGLVSYAINETLPKVESRAYSARFEGDVIVAQGETKLDALQERLDLEIPDQDSRRPIQQTGDPLVDLKVLKQSTGGR